MAISKQDKQKIVSELTDSLSNAKGTVFATYSGITVKEMQELRSAAKEAGVSIKVVKNRLVKVAIDNNKNLKDIDTSSMAGQLMYAMSDADEVAPAQTIHTFSKTHPNLELRGGFDATGVQFSEEEVKALALLPSKDQLRGQLVGTIAAPLSGFANVLAGNTRGLLNVLNARKEAIEA